ncbi:hypothetical protein CHS0354_026378 [Potamilus streckersoni]|uniref:Uncharacterized protein n=1 Tax=Potamilus streckersoni TaxID=2493646 RepID=A0AAE0T334_9BIVA|nr:hypothetical protein CHS0354_026378 [Potamilus streckersoni]
MSNKKEKIVVAAIDFGTTYSGYAFSFKHDYETDPTKVSANHVWNSGSLLSLKQPTCVLCKPDGQFDSFGYDAEDRYIALAEENNHGKWYFFRRFKMVLHEKQAGIDGSLLTIALEPETASMYCQLLSSDKLSSMGKFDDKKYMVIDLGASGGAWGGTKVDEEFNQMIIKIIGAPTFKKFCDQHKAGHMELLREFEIKKRKVRTDKNEKITLTVPLALNDTYEKICNETIKDAIEQTPYKGKIVWIKDKIRLDAELFRNLFQNCISNITKHLADLLEKPGVKETSTLLMVGGFSECQLMQEAIRTSFPKAKVVIPKEAGLAVLNGAVIFGHTPQIITSRIAKYTYGINISPPFDPARYPQDKKVSVGGYDRCKDVFKKYIEVGESVKTHEGRTGKHVTIKSNQKEMLLKVYASPDKNPMFVTEPNCEMLGKVVVKLPDTAENMRVDVKMMFGETELMVEAEEETMKSKFVAYFDFL